MAILDSDLATLLAGLVVSTAGVLMIGFAGLVFARPALAARVLKLFASSARAHYIEQSLRIVFGAAIVVLSPAMWFETLFRVLGWAIVISSVALILIPWRWHHRFGALVLPELTRHIRLYAAAVCAFGVFLLVSILKG
jgi:hypothetical protein